MLGHLAYDQEKLLVRKQVARHVHSNLALCFDGELDPLVSPALSQLGALGSQWVVLNGRSGPSCVLPKGVPQIAKRWDVALVLEEAIVVPPNADEVITQVLSALRRDNVTNYLVKLMDSSTFNILQWRTIYTCPTATNYVNARANPASALRAQQRT
jgi:hypothetical protein